MSRPPVVITDMARSAAFSIQRGTPRAAVASAMTAGLWHPESERRALGARRSYTSPHAPGNHRRCEWRSAVRIRERHVHRVVNGEIYMHVALREQHERRGHEFASCSPLGGHRPRVRAVGTVAVRRLSGTFGLALWYERWKCLLDARDHLTSSQCTGGATDRPWPSPSRSAPSSPATSRRPCLTRRPWIITSRGGSCRRPRPVSDHVSKLAPASKFLAEDGRVRRQAGARLIPAGTLRRCMRPFATPDDRLRSSLGREVAREFETRPELGAVLEPPVVARPTAEHRSGRSDHKLLLHCRLEFAYWHAAFIDAREPVGLSRGARATVSSLRCRR
jgi:Glutamine amidotransferase domain